MQPNSLAALLTTDIPDPTDFHSPSLRQLDSALRCTICSEWFDAPVTLACGHSFCSLVSRELIVFLLICRLGADLHAIVGDSARGIISMISRNVRVVGKLRTRVI